MPMAASLLTVALSCLTVAQRQKDVRTHGQTNTSRIYPQAITLNTTCDDIVAVHCTLYVHCMGSHSLHKVLRFSWGLAHQTCVLFST